jgi:hypothetical protein
MNEINEKMIIKVLPAEGSNPEFAPARELQAGVECYGYLLQTFDKEHSLNSACMGNISMQDITDAICENTDDDVITAVRRAMVVAEAFMKADRIDVEQKSKKAMKRIMKVMHGIDPDEEFPEDLPDEFPEDPIQLFPGDE